MLFEQTDTAAILSSTALILVLVIWIIIPDANYNYLNNSIYGNPGRVEVAHLLFCDFEFDV